MRSHRIIAAACLGLLWIGILASPSLAQQTQPKQKPRLAPPDAVADEKALARQQGIYGVELGKAETPQQKSALAAKLLAAAKRARRGSADAYVLAKMAKDAAVQAGSPDAAAGAVDFMAEQFEIDGLQMKMELLPKLAGARASPGSRRPWHWRRSPWRRKRSPGTIIRRPGKCSTWHPPPHRTSKTRRCCANWRPAGKWSRTWPGSMPSWARPARCWTGIPRTRRRAWPWGRSSACGRGTGRADCRCWPPRATPRSAASPNRSRPWLARPKPKLRWPMRGGTSR